MLRSNILAWQTEHEETQPREQLVVLVVEYGADGHPIERERTTLPAQRREISHDPGVFAISLRTGLPL